MLGEEHLCGGVAVFVEVLGEAAFAAGEGDEVDLLARLWVSVPVFLDVGVAGELEALDAPGGVAEAKTEGR